MTGAGQQQYWPPFIRGRKRVPPDLTQTHRSEPIPAFGFPGQVILFDRKLVRGRRHRAIGMCVLRTSAPSGEQRKSGKTYLLVVRQLEQKGPEILSGERCVRDMRISPFARSCKLAEPCVADALPSPRLIPAPHGQRRVMRRMTGAATTVVADREARRSADKKSCPRMTHP